jgi:hypothetical protein
MTKSELDVDPEQLVAVTVELLRPNGVPDKRLGTTIVSVAQLRDSNAVLEFLLKFARGKYDVI